MNAAGRMQVLIEDLLAFSRVSSRGQPFTPQDLSSVVTQVLSDLEVRIQQLDGTVNVHTLPTIDADGLQMRQLFQNLIANALKFHRPGVPPVVTVDGGAHGDEVTILVSDNGIGFDEKYLDRIFAIFQRLHGREEYEGTGIGLAVCRKIVERHSGTITARSTPGEGTTFVVTLPLTQSPAFQVERELVEVA
jgi:light-regulated signal transduction histidine kinase (bacteriophytochrome)